MLKGFVSGAEKDIIRIPMKSKNLFDKDNFTFSNNTTIIYVPIYVGDGNFTLSTNLPHTNTKDVFFFSGNVSSGASSSSNGVDSETPRTRSSENGYVTIATRYNAVRYNPADFDYMLNTGRTALPYEPYGYQEGWEVRDSQDRLIWGKNNTVQGVPPVPFRGFGVPLESLTVSGNGIQNGTPAPDNILPFNGTGEQTWIKGLVSPLCGIGTYNDSVDLATGVVTRVISKIVFTGEESWNLQSVNQYGIANFRTVITGRSTAAENDCICTHFYPQTTYIADTKVDGIYINTSNTCHLRINSSIASTVEEMEAWLTSQYQNGTPVTVWYVAATSTTEHASVTAGSTGTMTGLLVQSTNPVPTTPVTPVSNGILQPNGTYDVFAGNLFNLNATDTTSGYVNGAYLLSDGSESANSIYRISEYIEVQGSTVYTLVYGNSLNNPSLCFYDSSKQYISGQKYSSNRTVTVTSPSNAKYIRISYTHTVRESVMLNSSSTALPYEPYGWKVPVTDTGANLLDRSTEKNTYIKDNGEESTGQSATSWYCSDFIQISPNSAYYFSVDTTAGATAKHAFYDANKDFISYIDSGSQSFTTPVNAAFARFSYRVTSTQVMLNIGSTAIPYVPYQSTTTPLYLGTNQTLRRIKKLVLTGEETNWSKASSTYAGCFYTTQPISAVRTTCICTHLPYIDVSGFVSGTVTISNSNRLNLWFSQFDNTSTLQDFKSYLAEQYAAGNPVTVWYVLDTPETAIVNEPLCKIGDYADELTVGSDTVPIATIVGTNVLTVDTTVQPSNVSITGHIKPIT